MAGIIAETQTKAP